MSIEVMRQALEALEGVVSAHNYEGGTPVKAITALRQAISEAGQAQPVEWSTRERFYQALNEAVETTKERMFIRTVTMRCKDYDIALPVIKINDGHVVVGQGFTPHQREWVGLTGDEVNEFATRCRAQSEKLKPNSRRRTVDKDRWPMVKEIRQRIMCDAYDLADRGDSEGYNAIKVMCSDVLQLIDEMLDKLIEQPVANNWSVFNTAGAEVASGMSLADAVAELTPQRMGRGWSAVCVVNKDNPPLYTAPPQRLPLTDEEIEAISAKIERSDFFDCVVPFARAIEAKLKDKNSG